MQNGSILAGVPIIESPFFADLIASHYFDDAQQSIAQDLNLYGFAVLPNFFQHIDQQAQQIRQDLQPLFDQCKESGQDSKQGIFTNRIQDAFKRSPTVKQLATDPRMLALLSKLYGREAFAFQTLNFESGSQQATHSDAVHFHSLPERFMCGVWIALEDVTLDSGPLCYYPGSHVLPIYDSRQVGFSPSQSTQQDVYEPLWNKLIETHRLRKQVFTAKAGDALIWTANLLHGGEPILRAGSTRWSQVTHYYFEGCRYYTPMHSDLIEGQIAHRDPVNIALGVKNSDVPALKRKQAEQSASPGGFQKAYAALLKFLNPFGAKAEKPTHWPAAPLPADFDPEIYSLLNPDVIEAGLDPTQHYSRHGHLEGRPYKVSVPPGFDAEVYQALNPDVVHAGFDPVRHYILHGHRENRRYRH
jgi:hypothetical protein